MDRAHWHPALGPLMTRWAAHVSPEHVHPEYPRPQFVREAWRTLNGLWQYAVTPKEAKKPQTFDGHILVPFPIESSLSGVGRRVDDRSSLWYRRTFTIPDPEKRTLLHFGAVDWETTVWVNGVEVGTHQGGYDPFSIDITTALGDATEQELLIAVWDPTDRGTQPRGKQAQHPEGIWYTPTTGIWQSVWLEPVPHAYLEGLTITPDIDTGTLQLTVNGQHVEAGYTVRATALEATTPIATAQGGVGEALTLTLDAPRLWSPDDPYLYDLHVELLKGGEVIDRVESYFAMRSVTLGQDDEGVTRLLLNGQPLFQFGPLDQGFWPDGLYTPPTDEALCYDLEVTKALGFNMVRKHVKVESARWYHHADRLGLLVWQDMPNGDRHVRSGDGEINRSEASAAQFEVELARMVKALYNHPSVVMWVLFNEGWGQYDTVRMTKRLEQLDPSRLINSVSGWNDMSVGAVHDIHSYPGPDAPPLEPKRAAVLGEFGGLGLPLKGHTWQDEANWGYRSFEDQASLTEAYLELLSALRPLVLSGLAAAVYTQTSDVEVEVNGLMSYDREVIKLDAARITEANRTQIRADAVTDTATDTVADTVKAPR